MSAEEGRTHFIQGLDPLWFIQPQVVSPKHTYNTKWTTKIISLKEDVMNYEFEKG